MSPLEDGVVGITGPEVVVLTRLLAWRRSITLLEVVGSHVVGRVGVVGVVAGGRGVTLAVTCKGVSDMQTYNSAYGCRT